MRRKLVKRSLWSCEICGSLVTWGVLCDTCRSLARCLVCPLSVRDYSFSPCSSFPVCQVCGRPTAFGTLCGDCIERFQASCLSQSNASSGGVA